MTVIQLIKLLKEYNPEADCVISIDHAYSEYTTGEEQKNVTGLICWPNENKKKATMVEITRES